MPTRKEIIAQLLQLANEMDEKGLTKEADTLTLTAQFYADDPQSEELPESEMYESLPDEDLETQRTFGDFDSDFGGDAKEPTDYVERLNEFQTRLHELEAASIDSQDFEQKARALADSEFPDLFFETDNVIDDAVANYLRRRPEHLQRQIREHAFPNKENEFRSALEEAGINVV